MAARRSKSGDNMKNRTSTVAEPISEEEQTQITQELKIEAEQQTMRTRTTFFYLLVGISIIYIVCVGYTIVLPYEMQHQRHFTDVLPIAVFLGYYAVCIYCYAAAAMIVRQSTSGVNRVVRLSAYLLATGSLVAWLAVFWYYNVTNPLLYWMPLSNVAALLLSQYVDSDSSDLIQSAERLEQYKYNCKGV